MELASRRTVGWAFVLLGLFGAAFAVAGLFAALPAPAVGGTCGPGKSSESAIVAFFDPVSIGAGAEPAPRTTTANRPRRLDGLRGRVPGVGGQPGAVDLLPFGPLGRGRRSWDCG